MLLNVVVLLPLRLSFCVPLASLGGVLFSVTRFARVCPLCVRFVCPARCSGATCLCLPAAASRVARFLRDGCESCASCSLLVCPARCST